MKPRAPRRNPGEAVGVKKILHFVLLHSPVLRVQPDGDFALMVRQGDPGSVLGLGPAE
ncbi:MAG: hypothetical protein ABSB41_10145 [Anaerolineales bacterium]